MLRPTAPLLLVLSTLAASAGSLEQATSPASPETSSNRYPLLWVIEAPPSSASPPSYLFGTIHLPDERVTDLPDAVRAAIDEADALYTEVALDGSTQMEIARAALLPEGTTLRDRISEETYRRLETFLAERGMPLPPLTRLEVWMVALTVELVEVLDGMSSQEALDARLFRRAQEAGKEVGGVETVEEQLAIFDSLSAAEQERLLVDALDRLEEPETGDDWVEGMIETYLSGDAERIATLMSDYIEMDDPLDRKLNQTLIVERNRRMADRIAEKLRAHPQTGFFFALGAAHFPGEDGVLSLLRHKGLEVTRLHAPPPAADR